MNFETISVDLTKCSNLFTLVCNAFDRGIKPYISVGGYDLTLIVDKTITEFPGILVNGIRGVARGEVMTYNKLRGQLMIPRN